LIFPNTLYYYIFLDVFGHYISYFYIH